MRPIYRAETASQVLPPIMADLLETGQEVGSRNGRVKEFLNASITLTDPVRREILTLNRKANVYAQIAETMWVLAGRNDVEWLSAYLPRAKDYSDDGEVWRGGYGPRLRGGYFGFDQVQHVVSLLKNDPLSRRAVIAIYEPTTDASPGKDIPCNDFLQFQSRLGELHMTVTVRSNDVMWGWSGINAFEWSVLQEIVASLLGISVGTLTFNIGSLHLYEKHWNKATILTDVGWTGNITRFNPDRRVQTVDDLDLDINQWFDWEALCREGKANLFALNRVTDPLFKSWAAAIAYYWQREAKWLEMLNGTALAVAIARSPALKPSEAPGASRSPVVGAGTSPPTSEAVRAFYEFVKDLHATKHASYGNSWKKRGEKMSILANIARKVDRLGVGDEYDSSADTVIDLLVYLIKYSYWIHGRDDGPDNVNLLLGYILGETEEVITERWLDLTFADITHEFNAYCDKVDDLDVQAKDALIKEWIMTLAPVARDLWLAENPRFDTDEYRGADHE